MVNWLFVNGQRLNMRYKRDALMPWIGTFVSLLGIAFLCLQPVASQGELFLLGAEYYVSMSRHALGQPVLLSCAHLL